MKLITKREFFDTTYCPTYGWINRTEEGPGENSLIDELRLEEGIEVHDMAKELFTDGITALQS